MKVNSYIFNSNNRKAFLIRTTLFLSILFSIILLTGLILKSTFQTESKINGVDIEENIDWLILGSSQAEAAYDAKILTSLSGKNCYNAGAKGQQPDSTYYVLKDILEEHTPELIILDVYWRTLDGNVDLSQLIRAYESISSDNVKEEFLQNGFSLKNRFDYSIPILRYRSSLHSSFEKTIQSIVKGENPFRNKNEVISKSLFEPQLDGEDSKQTFKIIDDNLIFEENKFRYSDQTDFNARELNYLRMISRLCKERGVQVIICAAPILPESISFVDDYNQINETLTNLFREEGFEYHDYNLYNEAGEITNHQHYKDENHMNRMGAEVFSTYIYESLLSHF